jgi:hypothetical protein
VCRSNCGPDCGPAYAAPSPFASPQWSVVPTRARGIASDALHHY